MEFSICLADTPGRRADRRNFAPCNRLRSDRRRIVDFNIFRVEYWTQFSNSLTKRLCVELVYAEIMGVIKGSISSTNTFAPLSRAQYSSTSCRLAPSFSTESERDRVYTIFEQYERMKHERMEIDYVDRAISLLKLIKESQPLSSQIRQAFDELYVDGK